MAERSGLRPDNISRCMTGRTLPRADTLLKMTEVLEVSTDWLLDRTTNPAVGGKLPSNATDKAMQMLADTMSPEDHAFVTRKVGMLQKDWAVERARRAFDDE